MAGNSEKIELLGKGLYTSIPDVLTLKSIPTISELEFVSAEDFEKTMLDVILPSAIEEDIDCKQLLEIDFHWICRALRILNYGPYFTTNTLFCGDCGTTSQGDYSVDLRTIDCKPLPDKFVNDIVISKDEFIDFDEDIHIKLPTIQAAINAANDTAFNTKNGKHNTVLARICYSLISIGSIKNIPPVEAMHYVQNKLSPADYIILKDRATALSDYGLRVAGKSVCPVCGSNSAAFIALVSDKFFRPSLGDLRNWRNSRDSRKTENPAGSETKSI